MILNPHIRALPAYNAGLALSEFERIYGFAPRAKLDSNELPFGASPAAIKAGHAALETPNLYPDGAATALRAALAAQTGVDSDRILLGNGSEELIYACYSAVLSPGDHVLTVAPGFGLHALAAMGLGNAVETVPYARDWALPLEALKAALARKPKIFAIASPSNPIGVALTLEELDSLIAAVPAGTLLLLDEAYFEYHPRATLDRLAKSQCHWLSLRTFSKAYGLAGLRIGYGLCSSTLLRDAMRQATTPFNANAVAQAMALAALKDQTHLSHSLALSLEARNALNHALRALGFAPAPSNSNALFFEVSRSGSVVADALRAEGILVKPWKEKGFETFLRVTVGTAQDNKAFLDAIKKLGIEPGERKITA